MNFIVLHCENTYTSGIYQNRITFQTKYYQTICVADEGNFDIVNWQVDYGENIITFSAENQVLDFPIDEN